MLWNNMQNIVENMIKEKINRKNLKDLWFKKAQLINPDQKLDPDPDQTRQILNHKKYKQKNMNLKKTNTSNTNDYFFYNVKT